MASHDELIVGVGAVVHDRTHPTRESMLRAAQVANVVHEDWMQDWPVEVSDPQRLDEFVGLLVANKAEWELTYWLLNLVLASASERDDLHERDELLVAALVAVWEATSACAIAQTFEYWASPGEDPDKSFAVTPCVREVQRRIRHGLG
ncbi:hypothetical protein GV794_24280 [Nocardia cyriacigeorgica]|uniref:Uncharacterized protein n=1 Tax=Nocardia cyriacigeorgica TaxID=135487 RepID=A0A6P1D6J0_9NOCA|nr:hypothetical protein [Nocardia cyriacigeorgica]NEW39690.1 hypothetical protein [Nocardia cyriacigeorgica]NEW46256.1 hypothetical protein [Nocardia cyriacigeorgica]NEW50180.1 hypothetical protein [Nocardia cyriacigeorgica]NEW58732.1 hypothetical protein [Nocardia cyriacigeorgica]